MAHNDSQVLITCSKQFKEALGTYAQHKNVSVAWVVREAVAKMIGYDFSTEPVTDGRKKYESPEARKEAQREKAKTDRYIRAKLLELYEQEEKKATIEKMEASLRRKGIESE